MNEDSILSYDMKDGSDWLYVIRNKPDVLKEFLNKLDSGNIYVYVEVDDVYDSEYGHLIPIIDEYTVQTVGDIKKYMGITPEDMYRAAIHSRHRDMFHNESLSLLMRDPIIGPSIRAIERRNNSAVYRPDISIRM